MWLAAWNARACPANAQVHPAASPRGSVRTQSHRHYRSGFPNRLATARWACSTHWSASTPQWGLRPTVGRQVPTPQMHVTAAPLLFDAELLGLDAAAVIESSSYRSPQC